MNRSEQRPRKVDHARLGRDRLHHYRIACASAKEVDVQFRLFCLSRAIPLDQATTALQLFDEIRETT
jgi:hypothetical protein